MIFFQRIGPEKWKLPIAIFTLNLKIEGLQRRSYTCRIFKISKLTGPLFGALSFAFSAFTANQNTPCNVDTPAAIFAPAFSGI
jgi:hypothetical protein